MLNLGNKCVFQPNNAVDFVIIIKKNDRILKQYAACLSDKQLYAYIYGNIGSPFETRCVQNDFNILTSYSYGTVICVYTVDLMNKKWNLLSIKTLFKTYINII